MNWWRCLLLFLCCCSASLSAQTVRFVGTQFPYILEKNPTGRLSGVAIDVIEQVMQGRKFKIDIMPWKHAQMEVEQGQADVLIGPYKTVQRQQLWNYSRLPFYRDHMMFYTFRDSLIEWHGDLEELQHYWLGVPMGWSAGNKFDFKRSMMRIYDIPKVINGMEMLSLKRLDLVIANQREAHRMLQQQGLQSEIVELKPALDETQGYFGFSKQTDTEELKALFDRKMSEMQGRGDLVRFNQLQGLNF
ncbi:substrate-binding periplasmic protein [Neptunicella marina]|uniref:Transporter substrate-binding domain-containing protein n=1 Tax=Neptunicella marina TaxID=2125989 RepID=A0A8J6M0V5_9ALTE|nr:transporter substrate-binding domain-containing protein [Neptunicella marina]MBC3765067.1 transporter substrate-binding domain-containing protein [Neptunicella marina]